MNEADDVINNSFLHGASIALGQLILSMGDDKFVSRELLVEFKNVFDDKLKDNGQ